MQITQLCWRMFWIPYTAIVYILSVSLAEGNIQACGSDLTDLLSLLCGSQFHGPGKRSLEIFKDTDEADLKSINKRGGVVDECCHSQCDFATLQLYCRYAPDLNDLQGGKPNQKGKSGQQQTTTSSPRTTSPSSAEDDEDLSDWDHNRMRYFFVQRLGRLRRVMNMK